MAAPRAIAGWDPRGAWTARGASSLSRTVWAVSIPIVFAQLSEIVIHVTDTIFLARVGTVEVGAIAIADSIFEIWIVLTLALVDGIQILVARRIGQGRDRAVGETFNKGLLLLSVVSVLLTGTLLVGSRYLISWFVHSEEVGRAAEAYLGIFGFAILFTSANFAYSALLVGLARTRVLIWATIVLALTNIGLDYPLIFGKLGMPQLGIRGAAWGSLGAEIVTFLFLTLYVVRRIDIRRYGLFRAVAWSSRLGKALFRISYPVALQGFIEGVRWLAFFLIVEWISESALAAANIVFACYVVLRIPTEAFAETACSMVSKLIGEGKAGRIGLLIRASIVPAYLVTLPLILIALLFPHFVLSLITSDPAVIESSLGSLRVVALAMLVVIPGEIWLVAVTGTGDTGPAFVIEAALTTTMLGCSYLAGVVMGWDLPYIWMSLPLAALIGLTLSYGWMRSEYWKRLEI